MELMQRIRQQAAQHPAKPALLGSTGMLDYAQLLQQVDALAQALRQRGVRSLALLMDNDPAWALLDLAALEAGLCLVPLPPFFSSAQLAHVLALTGAEALVTDQADLLCCRLGLPRPASMLQVAETPLAWIPLGGDPNRIPAGICKVTFTSGTTADPKGVMLSWPQMEAVVRSLAEAIGVEVHDRHLALNPLALLLENIAGLYVPLWGGALSLLPRCAEVGLKGSSSLQVQTLLESLRHYQASSAIFSPHALHGVVRLLESGALRPAALRFAAVGGAAVSPRLLERAAALELPVFEGYGLSECASVVCLNRPGRNRPGSVGQPLPHLQLRIAEDGELLVSGPGFAGYLGAEGAVPSEWPTGDLGRWNADGSVQLLGRKRDLFITAFGRNVSPEWVERELVMEPAIAQAWVHGEARPWNLAVIVPTPGSDAQAIVAALGRVNATLPDYARIQRWISAEAPFSPGNGLLTGTGRLRRTVLETHYQHRIEPLYQEEQVA